MRVLGKINNIVLVLFITLIISSQNCQPSNTHETINSSKCIHINGSSAVEDFVEFGDYLLGSADNRAALLKENSDSNKVENGYIILFNPKTLEITKLQIENFPSNIAFHPHGMSILKNSLYVINHAYRKGSERVEVIQITADNETGKFTLKYIKSIIFGDTYQGILNDLAVIDENKFYITTWKPEPDSLNGPTISIANLITSEINTKQTKLLFCSVYKNNSRPNCKEIPKGKGHMNNGITLDDVRGYLYVADYVASQVKKFKINDYELTLVSTFNVPLHPDNLIYDKSSGLIYAGGIFGSLVGSDTIGYGAVSIDTGHDDKVSTLLVQKDFKGISVAISTKYGFVFGSYYVDGIMMCS
jgi:hypothetical protein